MSVNKLKLFTLAVGLAAVVFTTGCSLIGLGIGLSVDHKNRAGRLVPAWDVERVKPGDELTVVLRDGERYRGRFEGVEKVPVASYSEEYAEAYALVSPKCRIPKLGDSVWVKATDRPEAYRFEGFSAGYVTLRAPASGNPVDVALEPHPSALGSWRYVEMSDAQMKPYNVAALSDMLRDRTIPVRSALVLQTEDGSRAFPVRDVSSVLVHRNTQYWVPGLLVGMAVDALVVAAAVSADRSATDWGSGGWSSSAGNYGGDSYVGSCPLVSSFDGKEFMLDAEPFGGAIVEGIERTTVDNLEHLKDTDGTCRLRFENGPGEADRVDAVSLLAVDHPAGTRVIPDDNGVLHTIQAPAAAVSARTLGGADVRALLASCDGLPWVSNPFERRAETPADARDAVELAFVRPAGASEAKLVVSSQNAKMAGSMLRSLLELQGSHLPAWYDELNRSPEAAGQLVRSMTYESGLCVQVQRHCQWEVGSYLWPPASALFKDRVVPLSLEGVEGDTVRIRLECTAGFWMVDAAAMDFSADQPVQMAECAPQVAVTGDQRDVKEEIVKTDHRYCDLAASGRSMDVTFAVPSYSPGVERSYLLWCSGYYTIETCPTGDPQNELLNRFATVPGSFGQWAVQSVNEQMALAHK